jgi:hypothetical protein
MIESPPIDAAGAGRSSLSARLCQAAGQWRHGYLLLVIVLGLVWRFSERAIPGLQETRFMGGLHPLEVLHLLDVLKWMWAPPLLAAGLYLASFGIRQLNSPAAIAMTALCSSVLLAWIVLWALLHISL